MTLLTGFGFLLAVSGVLFALGKPLKRKLYAGNIIQLEQIGIDSLSTPYSIDGVKGSWQGEECILSSNDEVSSIISLKKCSIGDFENAEKYA